MKTTAKSLEQLTEADFKAYERVRARGKYNMLTDADKAARAAGLDRETYLGVLTHYTELMDKYPDVRSKR